MSQVLLHVLRGFRSSVQTLTLLDLASVRSSVTPVLTDLSFSVAKGMETALW